APKARAHRVTINKLVGTPSSRYAIDGLSPPYGSLRPRGVFPERAQPSHRWNWREELQKNEYHADHNHIADYPREDPARQARVWRLVVSRPGIGLLPFLLRNVVRPDALERKPSAISGDAALTRNGASQAK